MVEQSKPKEQQETTSNLFKLLAEVEAKKAREKLKNDTRTENGSDQPKTAETFPGSSVIFGI